MLSEILDDSTASIQKINSRQALVSYIAYLKEVRLSKINAETLEKFSGNAQKVIKFSNNWFLEATFSKSELDLKEIAKKTLDYFQEYFQEKFSSRDSSAILNNLGSSGGFYRNIPNSIDKEAFISTMQEYSTYLSKLVFLLENKSLDEAESAKKALDSLAIFPGKPNEVIFACLHGTSQRIRDQSMNLDAIDYVAQAIKNLLLIKTSQLASKIYPGNQAHLESCLLYLLHTDQQEISKIDGFYPAPIKDIELFEALNFVGNFSKKFDEEFDKIIDDLYQDYSEMPLTLTAQDNNIRRAFLKKLNFGISISTSTILTEDIFKIDEFTYELSLKSKPDFKQIILPKIQDFQHESQDFLREFSTLESLFYKDKDLKYLDIKKIDILLNLFVLNEDKSEEQKEIDITIGIKTLNLLSEKFKSTNILFLACFFEDFETKTQQKFEDFFYQPKIDGKPREIKPEYKKYQNIITSTINLYHHNLKKYYGYDVESLDIHKKIYRIGNISDQDCEDLEKKTQLKDLISLPIFALELKRGEANILHYPRQFFEKNTVDFIFKNNPREKFLELIQHRLVADTQNPLNNLNPLQIATYNKDIEILSFFLDLKFSLQNQSSINPYFAIENKFKFVKNNTLLSISLENKDLTTFKFLLECLRGVDMVAKIKTGYENQDEEIFKILKLVTRRENGEFLKALNLTPPFHESISAPMIKYAIENDNPEIFRMLGDDFSGHVSKINFASEHIIKAFFNADFIKKNFKHAQRLNYDALRNGNIETAKHLIDGNALNSIFDNGYLRIFLIDHIVQNKIEISKFIIEKMTEPKSSKIFCCAPNPLTNINTNILIDSTGKFNPLIGLEYTYLSLACKYGRNDIAKFLIEKDAKITNECFKITIKARNKNILNLLINSEITKSGKTKLAVLKEKSTIIFNAFSRNFDLEILKYLFEDLNDSEKKEFLNFNIREGGFLFSSTVFEKISYSARGLPAISSSDETRAFFNTLLAIKDSQVPTINPTAISGNLVVAQRAR